MVVLLAMVTVIPLWVVDLVGSNSLTLDPSLNQRLLAEGEQWRGVGGEIILYRELLYDPLKMLAPVCNPKSSKEG